MRHVRTFLRSPTGESPPLEPGGEDLAASDDREDQPQLPVSPPTAPAGALEQAPLEMHLQDAMLEQVEGMRLWTKQARVLWYLLRSPESDPDVDAEYLEAGELNQQRRRRTRGTCWWACWRTRWGRGEGDLPRARSRLTRPRSSPRPARLDSGHFGTRLRYRCAKRRRTETRRKGLTRPNMPSSNQFSRKCWQRRSSKILAMEYRKYKAIFHVHPRQRLPAPGCPPRHWTPPNPAQGGWPCALPAARRPADAPVMSGVG